MIASAIICTRDDFVADVMDAAELAHQGSTRVAERRERLASSLVRRYVPAFAVLGVDLRSLIVTESETPSSDRESEPGPAEPLSLRGFRHDITAGGQDGEALRHLAAAAACRLMRRDYLRVLENALDRVQGVVRGNSAEARAEVAGNQVGATMGRYLDAYLRGTCTRPTLVRRLHRLLGPREADTPRTARWRITDGAPDQPLVAVALHDGHDVRPAARSWLALDDAGRLHEEDPFTAVWTTVAPHRVVVRMSRFEVDLNRERAEAVYRTPEQAWGLRVWRPDTPESLWRRSLALHDRFHRDVRELLDRVVRDHGRFVLFDLHTYNHRRAGADAPPEDAEANPEINVGTRSLDRARWGPVVEAFLQDLRAFDFDGRRLDVRENIKFGGGAFSRWVARNYPMGCPLAIEVKKFFMDEWTGRPDERLIARVRDALAATVPGVLKALQEVRVSG